MEVKVEERKYVPSNLFFISDFEAWNSESILTYSNCVKPRKISLIDTQPHKIEFIQANFLTGSTT